MKILILLSFIGLFWYFVSSFKKFRKHNGSGNYDYASGSDSHYLGADTSSDCSSSDGGDCGGDGGGD